MVVISVELAKKLQIVIGKQAWMVARLAELERQHLLAELEQALKPPE